MQNNSMLMLRLFISILMYIIYLREIILNCNSNVYTSFKKLSLLNARMVASRITANFELSCRLFINRHVVMILHALVYRLYFLWQHAPRKKLQPLFNPILSKFKYSSVTTNQFSFTYFVRKTHKISDILEFILSNTAWFICLFTFDDIVGVACHYSDLVLSR